MNTLILDHAHTPESLKPINDALSKLLSEDNPDEAEFLALASSRDECIQAHLNTLANDEKKTFITLELEKNGLLLAQANAMFKASLNELSGLVRGRKAIEKYR